MGAAHHHGPGLGPGTGDQGFDERVEVGDQSRSGGLQLQPQRRVYDVAAGQAEMEVAALLTYRFGDLADEGDDVVVGRLLDLPDPGYVYAGAGTVPRVTCARATAISTRSIPSKWASSVQMAPISGSV
jgi:hypothetical protein